MAGLMEGKAGLVTGAAGGIGRATAVAFGRIGAAVAVSEMPIDAGSTAGIVLPGEVA